MRPHGSMPWICAALSRIACACLAASLWAGAAAAGDRVALVIGNSTYRNATQLPNPANDANDVADAFERIGFSVTRLSDATFEGFGAALVDFAQVARGAETAVVYFAGHGMEVGGKNWLIPVDAVLKSDGDIEKETVGLHTIMESARRAQLALVILDACRNNPFLARMKHTRTDATRAVTRGFVRVEPRTNMLVAYAARAGTVAADGTGRNSPYTTALLNYLEVPGLEIEAMFRGVGASVSRATKGDQVPFYYSTLPKRHIVFTSGSEGDAAKPPSPPGSLVTRCDLLAASPLDPDRPAQVAAVAADKIDAFAALAACDEAIRQHPEVARFYFQEGRAAVMVKNYRRAAELFQKASDLGSSAGMQSLGSIFANGWGYPKDPGKARYWMRKSADLGNPYAMATLGLLYSTGSDGGAVDDAKARPLFEQAAAHGSAVAMNSLGVFFETGREVEVDLPTAIAWYQKASDLGNGVAMRNLGSLYERGVGVPKDIGLAVHWYEKAVAAGDEESKKRLQVSFGRK